MSRPIIYPSPKCVSVTIIDHVHLVSQSGMLIRIVNCEYIGYKSVRRITLLGFLPKFFPTREELCKKADQDLFLNIWFILATASTTKASIVGWSRATMLI